MDFALSDEQRALRDSVRAFLRDRFNLGHVRALYDDPSADGDSADLRKAVGEQGWLAILVPEEHDGLGLGLLDASVVARCWGAGCVPGSWATTLLGGEALRLAGSPDQQTAWLPRVAAGDVVVATALRGEGGAWDASGVDVRVDADGRLHGVAAQVDHAASADVLVVAARSDDGDVGLYLADPSDPGITLLQVQLFDLTARQCSVTFEGVSAEALPGGSAAVVDDLHRRGAVLAANELAGIARESLTRTVDYDKTREQFGRPVGSFQALKHALADLHTAVTMAEHGALYAAYALDTGRDDAVVMTHVAKAKASDTARDATAAMIQFHGGIGYTWEHDAHLFFKRAKRLEYAYGDGPWHREQIARLVVDQPDTPA